MAHLKEKKQLKLFLWNLICLLTKHWNLFTKKLCENLKGNISSTTVTEVLTLPPTVDPLLPWIFLFYFGQDPSIFSALFIWVPIAKFTRNQKDMLWAFLEIASLSKTMRKHTILKKLHQMAEFRNYKCFVCHYLFLIQFVFKRKKWNIKIVGENWWN